MKRLNKRDLLDKTCVLIDEYKAEDADEQMILYLTDVKEFIEKYSKQYKPEGKSATEYHKDYYQAKQTQLQDYNREKYREKMKKLGKTVKTDKKLLLSKEDYHANYYENVTKVKRQNKKKAKEEATV